MGNNDICLNICDPPSPWAIFEKHKVNLIKSLRLLRDNLPRTFVALIMVTDLKALVDAHETINLFHCYLITQIACGCLFSLQYRQHRLEYFEVIKRSVSYSILQVLLRYSKKLFAELPRCIIL